MQARTRGDRNGRYQPWRSILKLIIAVVSAFDLERLLRALNSRGYRATIIDMNGGFLRQGNVTLLLGVQDAAAADALRLLGEHCSARVSAIDASIPLAEPAHLIALQSAEDRIGGGSIFLLNVERYERIA